MSRCRFQNPRLVVLLVATLCSCSLTSAQRQDKPKSARFQTAYQQGLDAIKRSDLPRAQRELEQAIRLEPGNADAHTALGWVLLAGNQLDAAIQHLRKA